MAEIGFDPGPFRQGLAKRERKRLQACAARMGKAREFLPMIRLAFLEIDPELRIIVLFGSLARGIPRRVNFDIDIGVRISVDELRAFRHLFRNIYQGPLNPRKVLDLQEIVAPTVEAFVSRSTEFLDKLR